MHQCEHNEFVTIVLSYDELQMVREARMVNNRRTSD